MATVVLTQTRKYNVGGVLLDRPFKLRRLGHFGFNVERMDECAHFYIDLLGFRISDLAGPNGERGFFLRYGSDHHAFVLFRKQMVEANAPEAARPHYRPENDINQITWQLQSLREVVDATQYLRDRGLEIRNEGRAGGPGSNWHLYFWDPDEQINELYYGIEQIGWDGFAKPADMRHGWQKAPDGPVAPEFEEIQADLARGADISSGYRHTKPMEARYDVDGILLPRPFKITRIGPVNLFVADVAVTRDYYRDVLGFEVTEEVEWRGETCAFLRCGNEHHSLGLFPKQWRETLGLNTNTSNMSFGLQLANYRQLRDAIAFLRENGVRVETESLPPELHPGIDYAACAFDPDGHCLLLYYSMEQLGWDGRPRPKELRRPVDPSAWPEELEPLSDTYTGEPFLGPWA
jgi:catechol 2,3-dioxygenase-like lactoylglutathione lyase family enzyme